MYVFGSLACTKNKFSYKIGKLCGVKWRIAWLENTKVESNCESYLINRAVDKGLAFVKNKSEKEERAEVMIAESQHLSSCHRRWLATTRARWCSGRCTPRIAHSRPTVKSLTFNVYHTYNTGCHQVYLRRVLLLRLFFVQTVVLPYISVGQWIWGTEQRFFLNMWCPIRIRA